MRITLVRNATLMVEFAGHRFLIDPMLDVAGAREAVPNTPQPRRNPLVEVPESAWPLIDAADTMILTHLHADHFDTAAKERLPKDRPVLCQPQQAEQIRNFGFTQVTPVEDETAVAGIAITRTDGQHGTGEIGRLMAPVSGFVFEAAHEPTFYVAGDTIWCDEVAAVIDRFEPEVIVVNGGAGQFFSGGPITMGANDIAATLAAAHEATIIVDHLDAIAHCIETRADLHDALTKLGIRERIMIPADGETIAIDDSRQGVR